MKFALLGYDPELIPLLTLIAGDPTHTLTMIVEPGAVRSALSAQFPDAVFQENWEQLLSGEEHVGEWDALLVGKRATTALDEQAIRKLSRTGRPLLCVHPAVDSMLSAYELEMFCRDGNAQLIPILPLRSHPLVARLREWLQEPQRSPIGRVERLTITREIERRTRASVTEKFTRDVDLIRVLVGDPSGLLASGQAAVGIVDSDPDHSYRTLSVDLGGESATPVRWSATSPTERGDCLTLEGELGTVIWRFPTFDDAGDCTLIEKSQTTITPVSDWSYTNAAEDMLWRISTNRPPEPNWHEAARSIEVLDALERSLKRGRRVEIRVVEADDLGNFKGIMASVGCAILMLGLFTMFACIVAAAVARAAGWVAIADFFSGAWVWVMLIFAGIFLVVQLAVKLFVPPEKSTSIVD